MPPTNVGFGFRHFPLATFLRSFLVSNRSLHICYSLLTILLILTSLEVHSNNAYHPGKLVSHYASLEVNLPMIVHELSVKKTSRKTKSDICRWQHLSVLKYLPDMEGEMSRHTWKSELDTYVILR